MIDYSDSPQGIGGLVQALIDEWGLRRKINEARVVETWATIAGAHVNAVTDQVWIKRGRLHVRLMSAVWRHELHHQRSEWRRELNRQLGEKLVTEIVFC